MEYLVLSLCESISQSNTIGMELLYYFLVFTSLLLGYALPVRERRALCRRRRPGNQGVRSTVRFRVRRGQSGETGKLRGAQRQGPGTAPKSEVCGAP